MAKNEKTEVLIVGAGPAGLSAAHELRRCGVAVTILDRHHRLAKPVCGGGLTRSAFELARISPAAIPNYALAHRRLEVRTQLGRTSVQSNSPLLMTIDRAKWAQQRVDDLIKSGVVVHLGETFRGFEDRLAHTDRRTIEFKWLVGADGARSRVRRILGVVAEFRIVAWQTRVPESETPLPIDVPTVWFDPSVFGSGYAWAFPAPNEVRFGCGVLTPTTTKPDLRGRHSKWLARLDIDPSRFDTRAATIGCHYAGHRFGRVFLAGDAAGLASSLTGEGISQALLSGREVALEIGQPGYRSRAMVELAHRHQRTAGVLGHPYFNRLLYPLAPLILKNRFIRRKTVKRYVE